jgi:5-formyltetrahydrofolate cyclo-ligase
MGAGVRAEASAAIISHVLDCAEVLALSLGDVVAAYESFGTEPSTIDLVALLQARGLTVIVPAVLDDRQLDWVSASDGSSLGVPAIGEAVFVIAPALACDRRGTRLGRGGGSYDRALSHVASSTPVCALVYEDEVVGELPREPHDRGVTMAVIPSGIVRFQAPARPWPTSAVRCAGSSTPRSRRSR